MPDPVDVFFDAYSPAAQAIGRALRAMVQQVMPSATEKLYARHNHVSYLRATSVAAPICYICPVNDYVRLGFWFGAHLPDPGHLLVGTGKRLRHVKVRSLEDATALALRRLVEVAWADSNLTDGRR